MKQQKLALLGVKPVPRLTIREQLSKSRRGRHRKSWTGNTKELTGCSISILMHVTSDRERWQTLILIYFITALLQSMVGVRG